MMPFFDSPGVTFGLPEIGAVLFCLAAVLAKFVHRYRKHAPVAHGDPRLLGLFSGVAYPEKSHITEQSPHLDTVHLYQRNLERFAMGQEEVVEELARVLEQEAEGFFGLPPDPDAPVGGG